MTPFARALSIHADLCAVRLGLDRAVTSLQAPGAPQHHADPDALHALAHAAHGVALALHDLAHQIREDR